MSEELDTAVKTAADVRQPPTAPRILVIEYIDGRPHSVVTDRSSFDFEYCKRYATLYFQEVGGGGLRSMNHRICAFANPVPPPGQIWTAPGVSLTVWESDARSHVPVDDAMLLAMGYVRLADPLTLDSRCGPTRDPFEAGEETGDRIEYCSVCDDWFEDGDFCQHVYFTDGGGEPVGAGSADPSEESIFAAFDWLATVERWREWLIWSHRYWMRNFGKSKTALVFVESELMAGMPTRYPACSRGMEDVFVESRSDDSAAWAACEDGLGWLTTLGPDTPAANAKTLQWIMAWRARVKS